MIFATELTVKTFGSVSISRRLGEKTLTISENDNYSRKLWGLLEYLIVFQKRFVSRGELIDAFWGDDFSGNPDNNLKALIHRARNTMSALGFPDGKEIIRTESGGYRFDKSLSFSIDSEKFEYFCNQAQTSIKPSEKLENARAALRLYDGDFLPSSSEFTWAATLSVYFHSKYLKLCRSTVSALALSGCFEEIISLCRKALIIEPYDEMLHCALIEALMETGAMQAALRHYTYIIDTFISELSVSPSKELTALYRRITVSSAEKTEDLSIIRESLSEYSANISPLFCGYSAFLEIYRLEARAISRTQRVSQLVMLRLCGKNGSSLSKAQAVSGMSYLEQAISDSLRCSDIFCVFGPAQYLLLLSDTSRDNAMKAVGRVLNRFRAQHSRVSYSVCQTLLPVLPAKVEGNTVFSRAQIE